MKHDVPFGAALSYEPCQYANSRLYFRGPARPTDGRYIAFVGGTETYGKFIERPFATLVEEATGIPAVNLGCVNASIDAFIHEPAVAETCRNAVMNVVQVMGAQNLSNRFYTVHPRRNDRFVKASTVLRAIYPEIDFSEFCFTRHMLLALNACSPERFAIVREEIQTAWVARMRAFLTGIGSKTLLLWFAHHLPSDAPWEGRADPLGPEPLFVTRRMIDALRPMVRGVVMAQPSGAARSAGTEGMVFTPIQEPAAAALPGVAAHQEAAVALTQALRAALAPA